MQIGPDETLEDLQLGGLKLIQPQKGFRYGMDTVLLADFASIHANDSVADFGTGSGISPLLLYGRGKGTSYYAFEIQNHMADIAKRNAELNHLEDIFHVYNASVEKASDFLQKGSIDAVVSNPPYGLFGKTIRNPSITDATARHQDINTLDIYLSEAQKILRGKGKMFLVYPAQQIFEIMAQSRKWHLEPKRFRLVYPYVYRPANLVLLELIKDAKPGILTMPPLIVYNKDGSMTQELIEIYHMNGEKDDL